MPAPEKSILPNAAPGQAVFSTPGAPAAPALDPAVFASVDRPADAAGQWLTAQFDRQAEQGEPGALTPEQRADLAQLLSSTWWRAVFEDAEDDDDQDATDDSVAGDDGDTTRSGGDAAAATRDAGDATDEDATSEDPSARSEDDGDEDHSAGALLRRALPPAVQAASRVPRGGLVLALYLRNLVNDAWLMAWDHELLITAIESSCDAADAFRHPNTDELDRLGWALLRFMLCEFRVETALLTGHLESVVEFADAAVATVEPIVAAVGRHGPGAARDALSREASNEETYYRAVRDAARTGGRLFDGDRRDAGDELARIHADVAEASLNPIDASEVRGHLTAITALNAARDRDWLHVDEGRVRIVYPFGIRTTGQKDPIVVVDTLRRQADELRARGRTLGGLPVTDVRGRLELSDVWQGTDDFGRGYRGATIVLGALMLERPGVEDPFQVVETRIQLSQLGNHSIVFEIALADAAAHRVAQAIHLATPVFGDLHEIEGSLRMRTADGTTVSGLPEVVEALLKAVRGLLNVTSGATSGRVNGSKLAAREGSFGVMATIVRASRVGPGGRTPLTQATELLGLWGVQPLLHPLPSGAASAADWALYDLDAVRTWPLLHLNSELLASNSNVTLLASFGSPDYAVREIESYIEFAHSLHGMYQGWQDTIRTHVEKVAELLRRAVAAVPQSELEPGDPDAGDPGAAASGTSEQQARTIAELDGLVRDIERAELALQAFVQSSDAIMLFIDSPAIVTSPPLRTDLDTILASNGYARLRDGFTHAVRDVLGTRLQPLLEVVHRRMEHAYAAESARVERERLAAEAAHAAELERVERQRLEAESMASQRTDRVIDVLGIVFTVIGFSGLVSVLQAGHPEWDGGVSWWLVVAILVLAALTGVLISLLPRFVGRRRPTPLKGP